MLFGAHHLIPGNDSLVKKQRLGLVADGQDEAVIAKKPMHF